MPPPISARMTPVWRSSVVRIASALASGCPVLAFRTMASIDTVRDGIDGTIVPMDDVEALARQAAQASS